VTAVSDNFNRADSTNIGAAWTEVSGDWEIVSNKVQVNTDDGAIGYYARYETDVASSDMFSQAVTSSTQVNAGSNTGVAVRMRAAANTSYQLTTRHAGDTIGNWRISAGTETQLNFQTGANAISTAINSGDTIRLEVVGSLLRSKIQGALVGLTVDTNITDGQRAGLNGYNGVGTDVLEADDFAGGALAADGGLLAPYVVGVSAQVTGVGTSLTPTVPAVVASGDLVVVHCTSRDAAQTMANPGSEGWSAGPTPTQTGLEDAVFAKVWGLGGQTDDTTPTFTIGSGTAGWGATVTVYRNPSHATAPWTSVAAAIVASGSQANASSATVTAPSVNHDGTHCTVVRLGSSADDNALNTPSTGALAYGAAAYDSTDGNDFAQAAWLREDITVTTNTGTSTVTETLVGNDVNNGITLVLAIPTSTDGTASPATIAATTTIPRPGTATGAGPAALAATTTIPQPATATGAGPFVLAATTAVPRPETATGAGPAAIAGTTSLPAASVIGVTQVQPAAVAATIAMLSPSVSGSATAEPSAIAATTTLPSATVEAQSVAQPAAIEATSTLPSPSPSGAAAAQPAAIAATSTMPTPGISTSAGPASIAAVSSLPAASLSGSAAAAPAVLEATLTLPLAGVSTTAGPETVTAVASFPTPSVSGGGSVSVTPDTIAIAVSVLAASVAVGAGPSTVAAAIDLPTPSLAGGGTVTPATVGVAAALLQATAAAGASASPAVIALALLLPLATATGDGGEVPVPADAGSYREQSPFDYRESAGPVLTEIVARAWRE
jgi:hypothetical protein